MDVVVVVTGGVGRERAVRMLLLIVVVTGGGGGERAVWMLLLFSCCFSDVV